MKVKIKRSVLKQAVRQILRQRTAQQVFRKVMNGDNIPINTKVYKLSGEQLAALRTDLKAWEDVMGQVELQKPGMSRFYRQQIRTVRNGNNPTK